MTARAAALVVVFVAVVLAVPGCGVDVDTVGPTRLAESEPGLLNSARALVFTFSSTAACAELVDASAEAIDDILNDEGGEDANRAAIQRIPMLRGKVDDRRGAAEFVDDDAKHTFGKVPSGVPVALLALALDEDPTAEFAVADLKGSIFAVACRNVVLEPGERVQVPLVLAPAGLR